MRRLFLLLLVSVGVAAFTPVSIAEGVLGVVNREVITISQVRDLMESKEKEARATLQGAELANKLKELETAAVATLVERTLVLQDAATKDVTVPESAIDERVQSIIDTEFGGDRSRFLKSIAGRGFTLEKFRQAQREDLIVEKMRTKIASGTSTPEEARQREEDWLRTLRQKAYIKIFFTNY